MLIRSRRLRTSAAMRDLVAETDLQARHLIQGHFIQPQAGATGISSLPGITRNGIQETLRLVEADLKLGIRSVLLFGVPDRADKSPDAAAAYAPAGLVPRAVKALKEAFGQDLVVMTDVCLCAYTDTGHCGLNHGPAIVNDESVATLARMAVSHAQAGADVVAPSDMMDGRIRAMREALEAAGQPNTAIMSYAIEARRGLLRAVPGGGRLLAQVRRPAQLPDGPPQRQGRPAGRPAGPGRGRRRPPGEAGPAQPGPGLAPAGAGPVPHRRLPHVL